MAPPFPNEIWLDIFHSLAKEGEYDALERCRVVCREFQLMTHECLSWDMGFKSTEEVECIKVDISGNKMRRWRGPQRVRIYGGETEDECTPIPHLAPFASRLGGKWPAVDMLNISNAVWRARDLDADVVFRDLARFSSITLLSLYSVNFPTVLTLGRLVCALPCLKVLTLYDVRFSHQPFDASAISQFRLLPRTKLETFSLYRLHNVSVLTPSFVELIDVIAAVSNRKCPVPSRGPTQPCPVWSTVRVLHLSGVTFPSVTTFARLLCALPALETLQVMSTCTFVKHGFDLRGIPAHSGVPSGLVAVELAFDFDTHSDPRSVADLVDLFVATGISDRLRHIHIRPSPGPLLRVTTESDVSLNRLVRHCGHSLHHLDLDTYQFWQTGIGKDVSLHTGPSAAPYFDLSENTCLKRLDLRVNVTRDNASCLCTSVIEVLSEITSTDISRMTVLFRVDDSLGEDLRPLMDGLPQLDAFLSLESVFDTLAHVNIEVYTPGQLNDRDEERADALRACLPRLDERGILGTQLNRTMIGSHWDSDTMSWKHYGVERSAAHDDVTAGEETRAGGESRTDYADTCATSNDDSDAARLQVVFATSGTCADTQARPSPYSTGTRVAAGPACGDRIAP
ncbi:hypothetical protein POSPLADRAFT_1052642 [Postia placenta MAD-698-R-SB12]|uniref:F-box domain-containing protein n=1 Tax=Postia placenta MAD-698-R-SB12 TaxID=670580 RepID=A0A1X6NC68_9APHY|nr:hypothetical protein POSPLADRAFT_1052642 [Postia placenta MAD-698-R-SB12]OSX65983.1 hypothetical protein POSPLADRAFT_1052642 [Postia placenta MAD-698-R-SB12]